MRSAVAEQGFQYIAAMRETASAVWFDARPGVPVERKREGAEPNIKRVRARELDADQAGPPVHAKLKMHGSRFDNFPKGA